MRKLMRIGVPLIVVAAMQASSLVASAHDGRPHGFNDLWYTWGKDPLVIICLSLSALLYSRGLRRLWRDGARGRGIRKWEAAAFAAGWFSLFVALLSPLHPWGEVLFSAHMTQHEILLLVSAPLMVLGRPLIPFLWALPIDWRQRAGDLAKAGWFRGARRLEIEEMSVDVMPGTFSPARNVKLAAACALLSMVVLFSTCGREAERTAALMTGGDPRLGNELIRHYGCHTCHTIPGVTGADGLVGPSLDKMPHRVYVAGVMQNTPANLIRWIQHPQAINEKTAMPNLGVSEQEARHIAAYLYTLR